MEQASAEPPSGGTDDEAALERDQLHCSTDDGVPLVVTRLQAEGEQEARPVVLVHGSYTDRRFWVTEDGFGLGPYLARRGFDVWIPELRGHGASPKEEGFSGWTAEDHIRRDLPAIHQTVRERTEDQPVVVAHSSGGLYQLGALSRGWIDPEEMRALAVFGTQISEGEAYLENRLVARTVQLLLDLVGHLPAPTLGLGPEIEPAGEMKELVDWKADGEWVDRSGVSYRQGLADLDVPLRAYAGAGDEMDPPEGCRRLYEQIGSEEKSFQLLSTEEGFSRDYEHAEMIASRAASREVWPNLLEWIRAHT